MIIGHKFINLNTKLRSLQCSQAWQKIHIQMEVGTNQGLQFKPGPMNTWNSSHTLIHETYL